MMTRAFGHKLFVFVVSSLALRTSLALLQPMFWLQFHV